jgi:hypothetical protein
MMRIVSLATRQAIAPVLLILAHIVALYVLDRANVVARLLGAAQVDLVLVALLGLFYVLRLTALFVAPGWLVLIAAQTAFALVRARARS